MKQQIVSEKCAKAIGPYSAGIATEQFIYLSGQLGIDQSGKLVSEDVVEQTKASFQNIEALLETEGLTCEDIIKTTVLLSDINDFAKVNEEYGKHFHGVYPSRSCFEVANLPMHGKVEIEVVALKK